MSDTAQDSDDREEPVPPGFQADLQSQDVLVIRHRRVGMGCMNLFLMVWLTGWTAGCVFLLRDYLRGGKMEGGGPIPFWFVAVFWFFEVVAAGFLTYIMFCRKSFRLDPDCLTVTTDVLGIKRRKVIPRASIERIMQVKDGGEDEDSFPSWGLKILGETEATLIYRQPYDSSRWLGKIVARWAEVEFLEAPR